MNDATERPEAAKATVPPDNGMKDITAQLMAAEKEAKEKELALRRKRISAAFDAVKATLSENGITLAEWNEIETMINQDAMSFVGNLKVGEILTK